MKTFWIFTVIENIVLYIIVAVLFWYTRLPWVFCFLLFVNIRRRANKSVQPNAAGGSDSGENSESGGG